MLLRLAVAVSAFWVVAKPCVAFAQPRPAARRFTADWSAAAWREWFAHRRFALDPWFYFAAGDVGDTRCPAKVRLSLGAVDSQTVTLALVDDRRSPPAVSATCAVPYSSLRSRPVHGTLNDGRVLWRLRAVRARESRGRGQDPTTP